jgi:two-component system NtrC family sensor kinase
LTLASKLALVLLLVAVAMVAFLLAYLGPQTTRAFLDKSDRLIDHSSDAMQHMALRHASRSSEVIVDLIRHTADSRRRMLTDLPLTLYSGDVERMRGAILARDAARSRQLQANTAVLTREMERRDLRQVDDHIDTLRTDQEALSRSLAAELQRSYLALSGIVILVLIVLLGLGLHFAIIRPIRLLHKATVAVACGDLSVSPRRNGHGAVWSGDEVAALSAGFTAMVEQLRASRAEIEHKTSQLEDWNQDLQEEVERQSGQLVHAAKMASVGTLAGGIAHEFNNLIGGIRGCAKEAQEAAGAREPLDVILRATNRATQITQQLLRFAQKRIEKKSNVEVTRLLDEVLELIAPQARRQGVTLERRVDADLAVLGDGDALHQVFLNLVTNALQAMPDGGSLTVTALQVGDQIKVSIQDTGIGIATEDLEHVFEPFFTSRGDAGDPDGRGTGLGLSVSYGIVDAHQGTLDVTSTIGRGSIFTATIPITSAK